ncbi:NAD(P)/FAD-dependent oxidoreductase [Streptomyces sp. NPDC046909]|uniref:flavin-containing monooxygenase n=1 Tax=Streptomyces sp. NPDC046909 TaxID=3155617 RepID=UPI0033CC7838
MSTTSQASTGAKEVDVLIVGAGLSGIGAARYLRVHHAKKSFAILESRSASGGTWDLFRYPGIRSDSDLNTFGYEFKPWRDKDAIADGSKIVSYIREAAEENGIEPYIRYRHRVASAEWSSPAARWTVHVETSVDGEPITVTFTAKWLFCASGYYRYDEGYTPQFPGSEDFGGRIVHPQHWPEELDYTDKKVVVIGSGATAMTLLSAMAAGPGAAAHVTMLQRTPTYVMPLPREDKVANLLRRTLGDERAYPLIRRKNITLSQWVWKFSRKHPKHMRNFIRRANAKLLPEGYDVHRHFNPPYEPWDQRLCLVPDGDLFRAIREGKASVVTDRIDTFTRTGIRLESGQELEADIIVTATGLNLQILGGMGLVVDGKPVSLPDTIAYRGMMLSEVPNLAFAIGYTNSSWTLKIGLLSEYFCRLLSYMDEHRYDIAVAVPDEGTRTRALLDFAAGYVQRSLAQLPRQGTQAPWLMSMSYHHDRRLLRDGEVADRFLRFSSAAPLTPQAVSRRSTEGRES